MEIYKMYGGTVTLLYDQFKHIYYESGQKLESVTGATGMVGDPNGLIYWAVNKVCIPYIKARIEPGKTYDEIFLSDLWTEAGKQHKKKLTDAGNIGTQIHNWIESWIKTDINKHRTKGTPIIYPGFVKYPEPPVNVQMKNATEAFIKFTEEHKVEFKESERKIFSRLYRFAGTEDWEAIIDNELCLGDTKTSNAIHTSYRYQTAAYQHARWEETGADYRARWILRIGKDTITNKKTGEEEVEFEALRIDQSEFNEDFKTFLAALQVKRREQLLNPPKWRKD